MSDQQIPSLKGRQRLSQVVNILNGKHSIRTRSEQAETAAYHSLQRVSQLVGLERTYKPIADDGERLPPESTRLQTRAEDVIASLESTLIELFDATATAEVGNARTTASVKIDGRVLVEGVPAPYLLFLEKQLVRLHAFADKLPVLDPSEEWNYSDGQRAYATKPAESSRSKKVPRVLVKAKATDKHPEQTEIVHEDQVVGYWTAIKYSGAVPEARKAQILRRIERLQDAVKAAREEANTLYVERIENGKAFYDFIFGA
jgi:hypothetical protein